MNKLCVMTGRRGMYASLPRVPPELLGHNPSRDGIRFDLFPSHVRMNPYTFRKVPVVEMLPVPGSDEMGRTA